MKKSIITGTLCCAALLWSMTLSAQSEGTWEGEVVDLSCYVASGAKGAGHAECAKSCVKSGQPMGLLTDDGTLVLLAKDSGDDAPYEALKDLAGEKAEVKGTLSERNGMKMVVVKGSAKAGP